MKSCRAQLGFTLTELLTVLAIIGVLSSLALPSFQQSHQRSQRTLAKTALLKSAHWLERSVSSHGVYPLALPEAVWFSPDLRYRISMTGDGSTFILKAVPTGGQASDACGEWILHATGEREVQNATLSADKCWGS
jgi:type IV pilus assembly protein PilE